MKAPIKLGRNKILFIGLIVVAVAGYYIYQIGSSSSPAPLTTEDTGNGDADTISQKLVIELNRLKALGNIDDKLLHDPVFNSLQDYTQTVVPQPLGRSNPFAPMGQ